MNKKYLTNEPDGELAKEVYAHFGLCMYLAQVFETGLINILTTLETSSSEIPTRSTFDKLYEQHKTLSFGNLLRKLERHNFLPNELFNEVERLKLLRDELAHHFFRDHVLDFVTAGGCHKMIEKLELHREEFLALDEKISKLLTKLERKLGVDQKQIDKIMEEKLEEARKKAAPLIKSRGGF